jgi:hypothetical protein
MKEIMSIQENSTRPLMQRENCLGCLVLAKDMQEVAFCALKYPIDNKLRWSPVPLSECPKPFQQKHKPLSPIYAATAVGKT